MTTEGIGPSVALTHDAVEVGGQWYVHASAALADDRTHILKDGDTFGVLDRYGEIVTIGLGEQGLYHEGTRHLSLLAVRLGRKRPLLLGSTLSTDDTRLLVDVANPELTDATGRLVPAETVHLRKEVFLYDRTCFQRLTIQNYGRARVQLLLALRVEADFRDVFEVRGMQRARRGALRPAVDLDGGMRLEYAGLDGVRRTTTVTGPPGTRVTGGALEVTVDLAPGERAVLPFRIECAVEERAGRPPAEDRDPATPEAALESLVAVRASALAQGCTVSTSNDFLNRWLERSRADLVMLRSGPERAGYPAAGIPWFSTPFGRDGLITALEMLWVDPGLAASVLRFLAATQAHEVDPNSDAAPGKILHEMRSGEMSTLGEVPFARYYGSVDATPLFVILAGAYVEATADRALLEELWPHVMRALDWIDNHGDVDGDGFVEYVPNPRGLIHQGWKDSSDSVFHADGTEPRGPIALCEVQAYVFAAKRAAAGLAERLGRAGLAVRLRDEAEQLRTRFEAQFWLEEHGTYAIALDGDKQPCAVSTSNAGHALFAGVASGERAALVQTELFSPRLFSGWGVRTLATDEARYNPMSYHNGSVWPHDNALIAQGLSRYGRKDRALQLLDSLFDVSLAMDQRLPELLCGFPRVGDASAPIRYPVANSPQAWAAGAVFMLLGAALGLTIDGERQVVSFDHPALPASVDMIALRNLSAGAGSVDLEVHRLTGDTVAVVATRREGDVELLSLK